MKYFLYQTFLVLAVVAVSFSWGYFSCVRKYERKNGINNEEFEAALNQPIPDEITVLDFDHVNRDLIWRADHVHDLDGTCKKRRAGPRCKHDH